ncbi:hypothetical protein [Deferrisoma camini]|nr:hypothetical protein [Deferrisoma camini]
MKRAAFLALLLSTLAVGTVSLAAPATTASGCSCPTMERTTMEAIDLVR